MDLWSESLCALSGYAALQCCKADYPYSLWPLRHCKQKAEAVVRRLALFLFGKLVYLIYFYALIFKTFFSLG